MRSALLTTLTLILSMGCASRPQQTTMPTRVRAQTAEARVAFADALAQMKADECDRAVTSFDRVVEVFAESRYVSASLYNAGLCLQRLERWRESTERYERLLQLRPGSRDTKHTRFQLAFLYVETQRFDEALETTDLLLGHTGLTSDERSEVMARRAEAWLGRGELDAAATEAREALLYYRTRSEEERIRDPFFVASASYTLAETVRLRSEGLAIPKAEVEAQRAVLERRAGLLLQAQRTYFDTIRLTDAYWASAAGYRIGSMYDAFWDAIMTAPVPPPKREMTTAELVIYRQEYRLRLAELAQPLIRHAIRYWELTLRMVQRTGVRSEWTGRIEADLEAARARLRKFARLGKHGRVAIARNPQLLPESD